MFGEIISSFINKAIITEILVVFKKFIPDKLFLCDLIIAS